MTTLVDFSNKSVLITGGTRGIGLNSALMFAKFGAQCIITCKWGSDDEVDIRKKFQEVKGLEPLIIQADVSNADDTKALIQKLKKQFKQIDIFISNASSAAVIKSFDDYSLRSLKKSISYSAWPIFEYSKQINDIFGSYPKYIIGVSSTGPDQYSYGYDYVAATKTVMETLCKYMSHRLRDEGINVNIVRSRAIKTQSFDNTFGNELLEFTKKLVPDSYWIEADEVAGAIVMLCSGLFDSMTGQILNVDRGTSFFDNIMDIYTRKDSLPIFNTNNNTK